MQRRFSNYNLDGHTHVYNYHSNTSKIVLPILLHNHLSFCRCLSLLLPKAGKSREHVGFGLSVHPCVRASVLSFKHGFEISFCFWSCYGKIADSYFPPSSIYMYLPFWSCAALKTLDEFLNVRYLKQYLTKRIVTFGQL